MSSMNTPALLILAISLTPSALTTVVNTIMIAPRITALSAKSEAVLPSPMIWKPLQSRGRFSCNASTTADRVTMDAVSISQPDDHPTMRLPSCFDQL